MPASEDNIAEQREGENADETFQGTYHDPAALVAEHAEVELACTQLRGADHCLVQNARNIHELQSSGKNRRMKNDISNVSSRPEIYQNTIDHCQCYCQYLHSIRIGRNITGEGNHTHEIKIQLSSAPQFLKMMHREYSRPKTTTVAKMTGTIQPARIASALDSLRYAVF